MAFRSASVTRRPFGQGMTEYIIIVALIAVSAIGVYSLFGQTIRNQTAGLAHEVAGKDAKDLIKGATDAADASVKEGGAKGLSAYNNNTTGAGGGE